MFRYLFRSLLNLRQRHALYRASYRLRAWCHRGHAHHCVCCGGNYARFLPYGNVPRAGAACPRCNSLERNRLLWLYMQQETTLFSQPAQVLHFAPEDRLARQLARIHGQGYTSADINPHLAQVVVDIQQLPFATATFNWVICSHVLGHVPDEPAAMREMYRVLKPSGTALILSVLDLNNPHTAEHGGPLTATQRLQQYGEPDLMRLHGLDFAQRIAAGGFVVTELDYRCTFSPAEQERHRLGDGARERIFVCHKPA